MTLAKHIKSEADQLYTNLKQRLAALMREFKEAEAKEPHLEAQIQKTRLAVDRMAKFEPRFVGEGVACHWCAQFGEQGTVREIGSDVRGVNHYRCDTCGNSWPLPASD